MSNLLSVDRLGFFPINQLISFAFKSICFLFLSMCSFQFNLQSKCSPGYFTANVGGMIVWLMLTAGQWPFRRVNVMCVDLDSLTLIFHFFCHFSMTCNCSWSLSEVIVGSSWVANIAVSSANVPNVVTLDVGNSQANCSSDLVLGVTTNEDRGSFHRVYLNF
jgi:hypothetical protein